MNIGFIAHNSRKSLIENFCLAYKYILAKHDDIKVVILDALTYAGNLGTIANDIDDERCFFVKGDT